jgi:hypothetical protein
MYDMMKYSTALTSDQKWAKWFAEHPEPVPRLIMANGDTF